MLTLRSLTATAAACGLLLFGQDAFAAVIPNGGSVAGIVSSDGEVDVHTFDGVAGQRGVVSISGSVDTGEFYEVFNPDSSLLTSGTSDNRIDLTQTGTYEVRVRSFQPDMGTGPYVVYLALAPGANEHGLIPNGGSAAEAIDVDGEIDSFTFDGVAGQSGLSASTGNVGSGEFYWLFNPDGTLLLSSGSHERIDLTQTGTYTIIMSSVQGAGTGPYEMHMALAPGANEHGLIPNGGAISEAIDADGEIDSFTFLGANGSTGTLAMTGSVVGGDFLYVFNPDGTQLTSTASTVNLNLTQDGTYTVIVQSFQTTGTGPYQLNLSLSGVPVVPLPLWSLVAMALALVLGHAVLRRA